MGRIVSPSWCLRFCWLPLACSLLAGCVSHEPRRLVPNVTLSPDDLQLSQPVSEAENAGGVDFGLAVTVNESDSLFNIEVLPGVRVRQVAGGGPADLAGLQAGDIILAINGTEVNQPDTLEALARQGQEGAAFTFRIRRGTAILESSLVARPRATAGAPLRELYRSDPLATRAGYETTLVQVRGQGEISAARVVELSNDSPLHSAGISPGDVILALDGQPVQSAQGLIDSLLTDYALGDTVNFTVYTGDTLQERRIALWDPGRRINRIALRPLLFYESSLADQQTRLSVLDFWLFALYRYDQNQGERKHELLEIFSISSDYGELLEESADP
ncbi:MAG: PDZ domain-containing protein [Gammaproteobacteria bacterium]|jgi:hypothetical protein